MKTRSFSFILILLFGFSFQASARWTPPGRCEQALGDIQSELTRAPDDRRQGLVTFKVPLTTSAMIQAYALGLFPWFTVPKFGTAAWFSPPERGILRLDKVKFTSREQRFLRNAHKKYHWTIDQAFDQVIHKCAKFHTDTWISKDYLEEYPKFAKMGYAHSIEIWSNEDGRLVGGLYGVDINGTFTGESMFHEPGESNVEKYALFILFELLRASGRTWVDTQVRTPLIAQIGGEFVPRSVFQDMRALAASENLPFPPRMH